MTPNIQMCQDDKCHLKDRCYRYTAIPGYYQAYGEHEDPCESFMDNEGRRNVNTQKT